MHSKTFFGMSFRFDLDLVISFTKIRFKSAIGICFGTSFCGVKDSVSLGCASLWDYADTPEITLLIANSFGHFGPEGPQ